MPKSINKTIKNSISVFVRLKNESLSSVLKKQYQSISTKVVSLFLAHYYVVARELCAFASTAFCEAAYWHKSKEYNTDIPVSRYGSTPSFNLIKCDFFSLLLSTRLNSLGWWLIKITAHLFSKSHMIWSTIHVCSRQCVTSYATKFNTLA